MNRAVSLVELLVTIAIVGTLSVIGMRIYKNHRNQSHISWTKAEMMDIMKLAKTTKEMDGFYHQYIYAMGYRPKGKLFATVGTLGSKTVICCNKYPDPGSDPCERAWRSGFLYYNCKDTLPHTARDNIEICDAPGYGFHCNKDPDGDGEELKALSGGHSFPHCHPAHFPYCNCNRFSVGGLTSFGKELVLDANEGMLCESP